MKNEKIMKVVATGILMAGLVTSSGGLSLAADNSVTGTDALPGVQWVTGESGAAAMAAGKVIISNKINIGARQDVMKEALADLVTAGTITQAQSDAVTTYFQNKAPEKPVFKVTPQSEGTTDSNGPNLVVKSYDPMKELVDQGNITQEQAQAISDKMRGISEQQMQQEWQTSLDTLVSQGTITQEQADRILEFLKDDRQNMPNMLEKVKDMTQEERKYLKENLGNIKDPVSRMVDQGIINQQQADALKQAMPSLPKVVRFQKPSPEQVQANLDALVEKGTITRDQATGIQDFMTANEQKMKSIMDRVKNSDSQQNMQYFKENIAGVKDPVGQMVDQEIIDQQQADAVREAVMGAPGVVTRDGSPGSVISGGPVFYFSTSVAAPDDSQD